MVKHTQAIRRLLANEMYECVWPFGKVGAQRVKLTLNKSLLCDMEIIFNHIVQIY